MADINQCLQRCLTESGGPVRIPDRPPSSLLNNMAILAGQWINGSPQVETWMKSVGLDPHEEGDSLLAVGIVVAVLNGIQTPQQVPST